MLNEVKIPLFPLAILPLPKEEIPLHIFEPKYKQLLSDVISGDQVFGIYYSHALNKDRFGALVTVEQTLKSYPGGETDIVVKSFDTFLLAKFFNRLMPKQYPGGYIVRLYAQDTEKLSSKFLSKFQELISLKGMHHDSLALDLHDAAIELDLDISDRLRYLKLLDHDKREAFLYERLRYKIFILQQEKKIKDNFFLN